MVRQRATSRSSVQLAFAFVVFRILSVTCSLTHALSQSLAHAQQFFTAAAPRVCTLVLFILSVMRELTSPVIDRVKNKVTYPAADGGQKICGIFSETALFKSYGVKKPTSYKYVLTATSMAPMERDF